MHMFDALRADNFINGVLVTRYLIIYRLSIIESNNSHRVTSKVLSTHDFILLGDPNKRQQTLSTYTAM